MRKILLLALVAPLFVACETAGGTGVSPNAANMGNPERALRNTQVRTGPGAGGGAGTITSIMGDGDGRPTIERGAAPAGTGAGCPPGTRVVVTNTTRGDRPVTTCQ